MPYILIRHKVDDYDVWKPGFDGHSSTRASFGSSGGRLFRNADDPSEIIMLAEVESIDRAKELAASDDLRAKMKEFGVSDQPDVYFLEEIERFQD